MPIDTSIYQNIRPVQVDVPSPFDSAQKAMTLSSMAMQQQMAQRQMMTQQAAMQAYAKNTNPDGSVNKQGVLSDLGKMGLGQLANEMGTTFAQQDKAQAEAKAAQMDAAQKTLTLTGPAFDYMAGMPESDRATAYPKIIQQLKDQGVDTSRMDHPYDPGLFRQYHGTWINSKQGLENQVAQANVGDAALKRNETQFGSRSANAELTSQYDKQASTIRSSQGAMAQMLDNYRNPSPQGDASLVLNAFKIKFPTAPDVNSLKELGESQATVDQWKNLFHKSASGGFDTATRNNLMRDGISTYRANVDTLRGIQQRFQARGKFQNVNDPTLTYEPAIDKTYADALAMQKDVGPYVPPTERGGVMAGVSKFASKLLGSGSEPTANAAPPPGKEDAPPAKKQTQPNYRATGSQVSADEVAQYAMKHNMKLSDAQEYLRSHGYVVNK